MNSFLYLYSIMPFHEIFSSSNLSGLRVGLKHGAVYTDNMSLNNQRLFFNDQESSENKQETQIDMTGITHIRMFRSNNDLVTVESTLDEDGLQQSYKYKRGNVSYDDGMGLFPSGVIQLHRNENEIKNTLELEPESLNVSTSHFYIRNEGAISIISSEITLDSGALNLNTDALNFNSDELSFNSSAINFTSPVITLQSSNSIRVKGDMTTVTSGGYINKFLKIQICNASGVYEDYQIPLMNPA